MTAESELVKVEESNEALRRSQYREQSLSGEYDAVRIKYEDQRRKIDDALENNMQLQQQVAQLSKDAGVFNHKVVLATGDYESANKGRVKAEQKVAALSNEVTEQSRALTDIIEKYNTLKDSTRERLKESDRMREEQLDMTNEDLEGARATINDLQDGNDAIRAATERSN
mmetsp:Transcript_39592/g.40167  ORF Transcript_39592/g.40167 Transcript_39592/m.40167 type:complete len:170 (-) Transcript_39592:91-600(-)